MYVEDSADWLCELATLDELRGGVFNIGYGTEVNINELAGLIVERTGSGAPIEHVAPRPGDLPRLLAGVDLIRQYSDFAPRIGFEDGLQRTIDYFRALGDPAELLAEERAENWT
jgi:nucleoside-diphosphate-sugar epimerase